MAEMTITNPTVSCLRPTSRDRRSEYACPHVNLALGDGPERTYRLDDPSTCSRPYAAHAAYDPRVHLAYILAQQGRDTHWLSRFTGLPLPAAYRIAGAAALSRA